MMSPNCLHVICLDCYKRVHNQPCSFCRGVMGPCIKIPAKDYVCFSTTEKATEKPTPTAFDVLFTPEYKVMYLLFKNILKTKWSSKNEYCYNPVCKVCMLQHMYPDVNITLLSLFYACATITQGIILDALTCINLMYGWHQCEKVAPKVHSFISLSTIATPPPRARITCMNFLPLLTLSTKRYTLLCTTVQK